jgi:hypothetical protein
MHANTKIHFVIHICEGMTNFSICRAQASCRKPLVFVQTANARTLAPTYPIACTELSVVMMVSQGM